MTCLSIALNKQKQSSHLPAYVTSFLLPFCYVDELSLLLRVIPSACALDSTQSYIQRHWSTNSHLYPLSNEFAALLDHSYPHTNMLYSCYSISEIPFHGIVLSFSFCPYLSSSFQPVSLRGVHTHCLWFFPLFSVESTPVRLWTRVPPKLWHYGHQTPQCW